MTQGYGPQGGDQGQWGGQPPQPGQQSQQPQQGQQGQQQWGQPSPAPQQQWGQPSPAPASQGWAQASPAPSPGGYPGTSGAVPAASPDGANWPRVKTLGMVLLIGAALLLVIRVGIDLAAIIGADGIAASNAGGSVTGGVAIGSSLVLLLLYLANLLVSIVMMILGIIAAVMGRGRARLGGILVAAGIPVATILYWVLSFVMGFVLAASGSVDLDTGELAASHFRIVYGVDIIRAVLMVAVIGLGAFFVHSTAKKKLSA